MIQRRALTAALLAATLTGTLAASSTASATDEQGTTVVISTFPGSNGNSTFGDGSSNYQTVGQTFRVPATATHLREITFRLLLDRRIQPRVYVYRWDAPNKHAYGHALLGSEVIDTPAHEWRRVTFDTDLHLRSGDRYVVFVSVAQNPPIWPRTSDGAYQLSTPDAYTAGRFVAQRGYGTRRWTQHRWEMRPDFGDLTFRMRFTR